MPIPLWVLLAFAMWTIATLIAGVGYHRWSAILSGRAKITDFSGEPPKNKGYYQRAMRAHANCVENLPVYGAVAVLAALAGLDFEILDWLAIVFMVARVAQTVTHLAFEQTAQTHTFRFLFFAVQIACVIAMAAIVVIDAPSMQET